MRNDTGRWAGWQLRGSASAASHRYKPAYSTGVQGTMSGTWKRFQDWLTVGGGVLLFIAPWALGFTGLTAMAWIAGILAVALAGSVVLYERERPQFVGQRQ